ncbi:hypothetical protein B0H12DRAFT_1161854 [Mycena haematopus]|nr:hypothetical protein B0H12DRAFT_1161854 [Mycena haematopus]
MSLYTDCGYWIRSSTGRLCLDFIPCETPLVVRPGRVFGNSVISRPEGINSFNAPNREATLIASLTLSQYDRFCHGCFGKERVILISTLTAARLGALIHLSWSSEQKAPVEIASLPAFLDVDCWSWPWIDDTPNFSRHDSANPFVKCGRGLGGPNHHNDQALRMKNGWTRCDTRVGLCLTLYTSLMTVGSHMDPWMSQGNYIISQLGNSSNHEDYAIVEKVVFRLMISESSQPIPDGYLFLCPLDHFQVGPSLFRWPDCPAYWSLDPLGINRLSMEDAHLLGFPSFEMTTGIQVMYWDESFYAGVRQFQQAKGFDPDSQDAARHLDHPLYRVCTDTDEPFTHIDDKHSWESDSDDGELVVVPDRTAEEQFDWDSCDHELSDCE